MFQIKSILNLASDLFYYKWVHFKQRLHGVNFTCTFETFSNIMKSQYKENSNSNLKPTLGTV